MKNSAPKRKLVRNRNYPAPDQINRRQDFARISKGYQAAKLSLLKKTLLWGGATIGVATIAGAILLSTTNNDTLPKPHTLTEPTLPQQTCVLPPLPGSEPQYFTYRISAISGGTIQHPTGSTIIIPPNAFVLSNGNKPGDSVEIKYREFHNPLDIFLSGIPMGYDSAGLNRTLESAGMLEIRAYDAGQELNLAGERSIEIKMATDNTDERFNLYELDTASHNWIYKGKDAIVKTRPQRSQQKKHYQHKNAGNTVPVNSPAVKPSLSDPEKFSFSIAYNNNDFPELAAYNNVLFEVTDNSFKQAYYKINWNKISLANGAGPGTYTIRLKKADTTISVTAKPVFEKEDYNEALAKFEQLHQAAETQNRQNEEQMQEAINKVNGELARYNNRDLFATANALAGVSGYRVFNITRMGYHNADYPLPPIMQYAYDFYRISEQGLTQRENPNPGYSTIFLVEKGKNTVFKFNRGEPVRCNPEARNLMWTITEKNQIAFFRIEDYRKLQNGGKNYLASVVAINQQTAFNEKKKFTRQGL